MMKECAHCRAIYHRGGVTCPICGTSLTDVGLQGALERARKDFVKGHMSGARQALSAHQRQYRIQSYIGNRSLFLLYDLNKQSLKCGRDAYRFFVQPFNCTAVLNIPWFICNIIYTNLFHLQYTDFCERCQSKCIPGKHAKEECDYNIEYAYILQDLASGDIVYTKDVYALNAREKKNKRYKSAYTDLFCRRIRMEIFLDLLSVGFSVFLWLYLAAYVGVPIVKILLQRIHFPDAAIL